ENGQRTGELLGPVGPVLLPVRTGEQLGLRPNMVDVLDAKRLERGLSVNAFGGVDAPQFVHEHGDRPEVADNVVQVQKQVMIVVRASEQMRSEERSMLEVERLTGRLD